MNDEQRKTLEEAARWYHNLADHRYTPTHAKKTMLGFIAAIREALAENARLQRAVVATGSAISQLEEVMRWHRDPASNDYNECEKPGEECAWCEDSKASISAIHAALNPSGNQSPTKAEGSQ